LCGFLCAWGTDGVVSEVQHSLDIRAQEIEQREEDHPE
jgi:hypothetical protein